MDLNRATLIGRLTRDPELRNTANGNAVTSFGLATNRTWKDKSGNKQESVEFHNIVMWGKLAEIASQYLNKGRRTYIEGRLQTRDWTGQDGVQRRTTEIIADNMIMLDGPRGAGNAEDTQYAPIPINENKNNNTDSNSTPEVIEEEVKVEDIPF